MAVQLTPALLGSIAKAALQNASGLVDESRILLDSGRYARSLALAVLAAEEFGKHMLCVSSSPLDLDDPKVVKKFWNRFRSHEAKYQNWHGQLIDMITLDPGDEHDPEAWEEMWAELPEVVGQAMQIKMGSLYVDLDGETGEIRVPSELVIVELAESVWKSVSLVIEPIKALWGDADLATFLEGTSPKLQAAFKEMTAAKSRGDAPRVAEVFRDLLGRDSMSDREFEEIVRRVEEGGSRAVTNE